MILGAHSRLSGPLSSPDVKRSTIRADHDHARRVATLNAKAAALIRAHSEMERQLTQMEQEFAEQMRESSRINAELQSLLDRVMASIPGLIDQAIAQTIAALGNPANEPRADKHFPTAVA